MKCEAVVVEQAAAGTHVIILAFVAALPVTVCVILVGLMLFAKIKKRKPRQSNYRPGTVQISWDEA